jgi:peptide deformylase
MLILRGNRGLLTACDTTLRSPQYYQQVLKKLRKEMRKHPSAVAIASNQVLLNTDGEAPAAFLYKGRLYINPSYEGIGEVKEEFEVCLSDITKAHHVRRFVDLKVSYYLLEVHHHQLVLKSHTMSGFDAVVFQHETDHLSGVPIWSGAL